MQRAPATPPVREAPGRAPDDDGIERAPGISRRLMSQRQPLGILPTLWFWREIRRTDRKLHVFVTLLWALVVAPLVFLCVWALPPTWASVLAVFAISILGGGLIEKLLRLVISRQRHLLANRPPEDMKALGR